MYGLVSIMFYNMNIVYLNVTVLVSQKHVLSPKIIDNVQYTLYTPQQATVAQNTRFSYCVNYVMVDL